MSTDLSQFQDAFFEESAEHLATMEDGLLQLEQHGDLDLLNRIFRAAHSIKGNSGMFGFTAVGEFTHKLETLLDRLRNGQLSVTPAMTDVLLRATDCLKLLIAAARGEAAPDQATIAQLEEALALAAGVPSRPSQGVQADPAWSPSQAPEPALRQFVITWTPPGWLFQRGLDPIRMIKELEDIGTLVSRSLTIERLPDFAAFDPEVCYLSWTFVLQTVKERPVIDSVFTFVREDSCLTIDEGPAPPVVGGPHEPEHAMKLPDNGHGGEAGETRPLGQILLESGAVSPDALHKALSTQKRLGEILIEQKAATPQQVAIALQKQQSDGAVPSKKLLDAASIRVDTGKIDKLINLVGELVITQSMLSDLSTRFEMNQLSVLRERIAQLERNTREIQERVMGIRMLPIGNAFSRFPRLVRDLSAKSGKKIQLLLSGEDTELDKTVIESIGDPLTHLVRNSADHGLETPDERVGHGKPEVGTIKLNAFHEGGNICITVEDDGRGLNRDKIVAKALKQGLVTETEKLADEQIWPLIFKPGFSTADTVTDVSGRGVGMDVVKRNIEGLGGKVSIRTAPGQGTTFTLTLPLTLAIIEGMTIRVGTDTYIVPLLSILESIQPKSEAVKTVVGKGELINLRGSYLPMMRLYQLFSLEPEHRQPTKAIILILETEGERVAVMVDEILGQQQVVIKSMEQNFRKVRGIAGATILGDGTVGFILDVRGLLEIARQDTVIAA